MCDHTYIVCCVCVCCHPIYSGRKVCGRTSRGHTRGRSHRISPLSFCGACLHFSCEKDSAVPFPRRPRSRILCTNELIVLHLLSIFILFYFILFYFFVGKNSSSCDACLNFSREKDSAFPFPRRSRSRILCTNELLIVLHLLGIFILFYFIFL